MRFTGLLVVVVFAATSCGGSGPGNLEGTAFTVNVTADAEAAAKAVGVDLTRVVVDAANASLALLPHHGQFTITVQIDPQQALPDGVGGFTDTDGDPFIAIDPGHRNLRQALETWLPAALAHELHHSSRIRSGPGYGRTLGQAIVSEGLADRFVYEVFPSTPPQPWDHALTRAQERKFWRRIRPFLNSNDSRTQHRVWFFGAGRMPRAIGYSLGYAIVGRYLAQHDETASDAVAVPARKVLTSFAGP